MLCSVKNKKYSFSYSLFLLLLLSVLLNFILLIGLTKGFRGISNYLYFYTASDDLHHDLYVFRALKGNLNIWEDMQMGYPYGSKMYSFPYIPWTAAIWGYIMRLFTTNFVFVVNSYYMLTFCVGGVVFTGVAYDLTKNHHLSLIGGFMYSYFQYHLARANSGHMSSCAYFAVPVVILLFVYICDLSLELSKKKQRYLFLCLLILGISDTFYAFFACIIIFMAMVYAIVNKNKERILLALKSIAIIAVTTIILLLPSLIYSIQNPSIDSTKRIAYGAYVYSFTLADLVAPYFEKHPLSFVKNIMSVNQIPSRGQYGAYLGIFAIIGLLFLIVSSIRKASKKEGSNAIKVLASCMSCIFAIGITGGFGLAIALFVTTQIRTYYRIVVFLYCVGLLGFLIMLQQIYQKKHINKKVILLISVLIIYIHLVDMQYISYNFQSNMYTNMSRGEKNFVSDKEFVTTLEENYDKDNILYLPIISYPENITETGEGNYNRAALIPMLSNKFNISFGCVYATDEFELLKNKYSTRDPEQIIKCAAMDGYGLIILDQKAMEGAESLAAELETILQCKPIEEDDYIVLEISDSIANKYKDEPIYLFEDGFYDEERGSVPFRWADQTATIQFLNTERKEKQQFSMDVASYGNREINLHVVGCGVDKKYKITSTPSTIVLDLDFSKGNSLTLTSDMESVAPSADSREINFMISNYKMIITQ